MSDQRHQLLPSLAPEVYAALRADIAAHGVKVPIEVDEHGAVIDGHHRAVIAAELGIDVPRIVRAGLSGPERVEWAIKANVLRRQLGPIAWAELFVRLATERGVRLGQGERNDHTSATVAEVAAELGVSYRTARRRLDLAHALADRPDLAVQVDSGDLPAGKAVMVARADAVAAAVAEPRLPEGRFDVIYADPPWRFDNGTWTSRGVSRLYPTLGLADITGYRDADGRDVPSIVADRAVLFLWVPAALLLEAAPAVLDAWEFEYRTNWVWVKEGAPGMGYWARNQHELLIVAARGGMRPPHGSLRPPSVLHAPRGAHSAKPVEMYQRIEAAYPHARRVELFARTARPGWAALGNQVGVAA